MPRVPYKQFAINISENYPNFRRENGEDDFSFVRRFVAKMPEYRNWVDYTDESTLENPNPVNQSVKRTGNIFEDLKNAGPLPRTAFAPQRGRSGFEAPMPTQFTGFVGGELVAPQRPAEDIEFLPTTYSNTLEGKRILDFTKGKKDVESIRDYFTHIAQEGAVGSESQLAKTAALSNALDANLKFAEETYNDLYPDATLSWSDFMAKSSDPQFQKDREILAQEFNSLFDEMKHYEVMGDGQSYNQAKQSAAEIANQYEALFGDFEQALQVASPLLEQVNQYGQELNRLNEEANKEAKDIEETNFFGKAALSFSRFGAGLGYVAADLFSTLGATGIGDKMKSGLMDSQLSTKDPRMAAFKAPYDSKKGGFTGGAGNAVGFIFEQGLNMIPAIMAFATPYGRAAQMALATIGTTAITYDEYANEIDRAAIETGAKIDPQTRAALAGMASLKTGLIENVIPINKFVKLGMAKSFADDAVRALASGKSLEVAMRGAYQASKAFAAAQGVEISEEIVDQLAQETINQSVRSQMAGLEQSEQFAARPAELSDYKDIVVNTAIAVTPLAGVGFIANGARFKEDLYHHVGRKGDLDAVMDLFEENKDKFKAESYKKNTDRLKKVSSVYESIPQEFDDVNARKVADNMLEIDRLDGQLNSRTSSSQREAIENKIAKLQGEIDQIYKEEQGKVATEWTPQVATEWVDTGFEAQMPESDQNVLNVISERIEPILNPLTQRMTNAEEIDMAEIEAVSEKMIDEQTRVLESENLSEEEKQSLSQLIELQIDNLLNYEFATTTTTEQTGQAVQVKGVVRTAKPGLPQKVSTDRFFGTPVTNPQTGEKGFLVLTKVPITQSRTGLKYQFVSEAEMRRQENGEYRAQQGTLKLGEDVAPSTPFTNMEYVSSNFGEDGNLTSVVLRDAQSGNELQIDDQELALDIAIAESQRQIGTVPEGAFISTIQRVIPVEQRIKIFPNLRETGTTPAAVGVQPQTEQDVRKETNAAQEGRAQGENAAPVPQEEGRQEGQVAPTAVEQEGETPPATEQKTPTTEEAIKGMAKSAKSAESLAKELEKALNAMKVKVDKGAAREATFMIPVLVYNGAIDAAILTVKAADVVTKEVVLKAINVAVKYINERFDGEWDKGGFLGKLSVDLTKPMESYAEYQKKKAKGKQPVVGQKVGVRFNLDVRDYGRRVVSSIHDKSFNGEVIDIVKAATVNDVKFSASKSSARKIKEGESTKFPMASVDGSFVSNDVDKSVIENGQRVFFNPKITDFFYDKDGREVLSASRATVDGSKYFAEGLKYGDRVVDLTQQQAKAETKATRKAKTVFHSGTLDGKGNIYVSPIREQANEYSSMSGAPVLEFEINENAMAPESEVRDLIRSLGLKLPEGYNLDELFLYEALDTRVKSSLSQGDIDKLYTALKDKGYEGIAFRDEDIRGVKKEGIDNFIVFDKSSLSEQQAQPEAQVEATAKALEGLDISGLGFTAKEGNKVVDENGKPIRLYRGIRIGGYSLGYDGGAEGLLYFTTSPQEANYYSVGKVSKKGVESGRIQPATFIGYVKMSKPLVVSSKDYASIIHDTTNYNRRRVINGIKDDGHDGIIVTNVGEELDNYTGKKSTWYIPFDEKSVISALSGKEKQSAIPSKPSEQQAQPEAKLEKTTAEQRKEGVKSAAQKAAKSFNNWATGGGNKLGIANLPEQDAERFAQLVKDIGVLAEALVENGMTRAETALRAIKPYFETNYSEWLRLANVYFKSEFNLALIQKYPEVYKRGQKLQKEFDKTLKQRDALLAKDIEEAKAEIIGKIKSKLNPSNWATKTKAKLAKTRLTPESISDLKAYSKLFTDDDLSEMDPKMLKELYKEIDQIYKSGRRSQIANNKVLNEQARNLRQRSVISVGKSLGLTESVSSYEIAKKKAQRPGVRFYIMLNSDPNVIQEVDRKDIDSWKDFFGAKGFTTIAIDVNANTSSKQKGLLGKLRSGINTIAINNFFDTRNIMALLANDEDAFNMFEKNFIDLIYKSDFERDELKNTIGRFDSIAQKLKKEGYDISKKEKSIVLRLGDNNAEGTSSDGLTIGQIIDVFMMLRDPDALVRSGGGGLVNYNQEDIDKIIDYVLSNKPVLDAVEEVTAKYQDVLQEHVLPTLSTFGYDLEKFNTRTYNTNGSFSKNDVENARAIEILNKVYSNNIPQSVPYSPLSVFSGEEMIGKDYDVTNPGNEEKVVSVLSNNVISRIGGGQLQFGNVANKYNNYMNGMIDMVTRMPVLHNAQAIFNKDVSRLIENKLGESATKAIKNNINRVVSNRLKVSEEESMINPAMSNWLNRAVLGQMFLNTRSAIFQPIATLNYAAVAPDLEEYAKSTARMLSPINFAETANEIYNQAWVKERFGGKIFSIDAKELDERTKNDQPSYWTVIDQLLRAGYTLTAAGDIISILIGGSPLYDSVKNKKYNEYIKTMSEKDAEAQSIKDASLALYKATNESQQSSNNLLISNSQKNPAIRFFLSFTTANQQLLRRALLASQMMKLGVGSPQRNAYTILQFGMINAALFTLISRTPELLSLLFDDDEEDLKKKERKDALKNKYVNDVVGGLMSGLGAPGVLLYNSIRGFIPDAVGEEKFDKVTNPEMFYMFSNNLSKSISSSAPAFSIKLRQIEDAIKAAEKGEYAKSLANAISFGSGIPTARAYDLFGQAAEASVRDYTGMERVLRATDIYNKGWAQKHYEEQVLRGKTPALSKIEEKEIKDKNTRELNELMRDLGFRAASKNEAGLKADLEKVKKYSEYAAKNYSLTSDQYETLVENFNRGYFAGTLPKEFVDYGRMSSQTRVEAIAKKINSFENDLERQEYLLKLDSANANQTLFSAGEVKRIKELIE